jgi:hypothetical protein
MSRIRCAANLRRASCSPRTSQRFAEHALPRADLDELVLGPIFVLKLRFPGRVRSARRGEARVVEGEAAVELLDRMLDRFVTVLSSTGRPLPVDGRV